MKDEQFMRVWNDDHDHFSADITRGLHWLATPFRRLGEWIALPSPPGEDSIFTRAPARCGIRPPRPRYAPPPPPPKHPAPTGGTRPLLQPHPVFGDGRPTGRTALKPTT